LNVAASFAFAESAPLLDLLCVTKAFLESKKSPKFLEKA
jgi:hypothetical protein